MHATIDHPHDQPRFGRALARLRTHHLKQSRKEAVRKIKEVMRGYKKVKRVTSKDALCTKCANLKPISDFLA